MNFSNERKKGYIWTCGKPEKGIKGKKVGMEKMCVRLYDYGARLYAPVIGRFGGVDPLAEQYPVLSPFVYVANNPILLVDPDGRYIIVGGNADPKAMLKLIGTVFGGNVNATLVGRNNNILKVALKDGASLNDLSSEQQDVYNNLSAMASSKKRYKIDVETTTEGEMDSYGYGEIYPDNFGGLPNEGVGSKLSMVDHFFREQRIKQNRFSLPSINDNRPYLEDHDKTLNEQLKIFGFTQGSRYDSGQVSDIDFIDKKGKYLNTFRIDRRGNVNKYSVYVKNQETIKSISDGVSNFKNYPID